MLFMNMSRPKGVNAREPPVEDLREKLNRRKQEKLNEENGVSKNLPPPDPSYNFLKDPMRGDETASPKKNFPKKQTEENVSQKKAGRAKFFMGGRVVAIYVHIASSLPSTKGENSPSQPNSSKSKRNDNTQVDKKRTQNWREKRYLNRKKFPPSPKEEPKHEILKQLPLKNIKVEVSGETGIRKCIVDESKIIELPKTDERKFSKQRHRETQKYYFNRQMKESRTAQENKLNENKEELNQIEKDAIGIEKQRSNHRKNDKQKKDHKKEEEDSLVPAIEHSSEEKIPEENAPCENK